MVCLFMLLISYLGNVVFCNNLYLKFFTRSNQ